MNTIKHIALIAAVSFFASCAKNEVVEPAMNVTGTDAAVENTASETTPLLDTDAQLQRIATHTTPLLDSDTPPAPGTSTAPDPAELDTPLDGPVNGKLPFSHNMEIQ